MNQEQAKQLFEIGGFFILPLHKKGTEFGIDGSLWAVKQDSFAVSFPLILLVRVQFYGFRLSRVGCCRNIFMKDSMCWSIY